MNNQGDLTVGESGEGIRKRDGRGKEVEGQRGELRKKKKFSSRSAAVDARIRKTWVES
jgi:hypothetical protein